MRGPTDRIVVVVVMRFVPAPEVELTPSNLRFWRRAQTGDPDMPTNTGRAQVGDLSTARPEELQGLTADVFSRPSFSHARIGPTEPTGVPVRVEAPGPGPGEPPKTVVLLPQRLQLPMARYGPSETNRCMRGCLAVAACIAIVGLILSVLPAANETQRTITTFRGSGVSVIFKGDPSPPPSPPKPPPPPPPSPPPPSPPPPSPPPQTERARRLHRHTPLATPPPSPPPPPPPPPSPPPPSPPPRPRAPRHPACH